MGATASNSKSKDVPYTDADPTGIQNDIKNEKPIDNSNEARKRELLQRVNKTMKNQDETVAVNEPVSNPSPAVPVGDTVNVPVSNPQPGVRVGVAVNVPPSNPLPNHLKVDKSSGSEITEDNNELSQDEIRHKAEEDKKRKENIEKERKRVESVKARLEENIAKLRKQYQEDEISFYLIDKATHTFNTKLKKYDSSYQATLEENKLQQARTKISNVQQEKSRLMLRLSEAASVRLRHNNPHIVDLSDGNRPTKLGEKFSELYDNQWTAAFEATRKKVEKEVTDREIAESLRIILEFGYEKCRDVYCKQRNRLLSALSMSGTTELQTISPAMSLRLKEFQRLVSQQSVQHAQGVVREQANDQLKRELPVKYLSVLKKNRTPYNSYIDLCTDITWYMQIQDPPLVLDFGGSAEIVTRFRPYTISGSVLDYIVWPAMLLHEGGPLVTKGVAQFKKKAEVHENETLKYTNASVTDSLWD